MSDMSTEKPAEMDDSKTKIDKGAHSSGDGEDEDEGRDADKSEAATGTPTKVEDEITKLARAFFNAATRPSPDMEDILPQEDSADMKLSVGSLDVWGC